MYLIPILNHCYQSRAKRGIKAILIYPMNAPATDQAKRLAGLIWHNPNLKGKVTAGLFVGEKENESKALMGEDYLITDKTLLCQSPPDILLTNYKMLDYLLLRPRDQGLWAKNNPETLRYLVAVVHLVKSTNFKWYSEIKLEYFPVKGFRLEEINFTPD